VVMKAIQSSQNNFEFKLCKHVVVVLHRIKRECNCFFDCETRGLLIGRGARLVGRNWLRYSIIYSNFITCSNLFFLDISGALQTLAKPLSSLGGK